MTTPENGDDTVMKTASGPKASRRMGLPGEYTDALPAGTRLHEFEIVSVIGQGGFGIVYLARDLALDRDVAIKEYMPSSLATRTEQMTVEVRSGRHADTFAAGLRSFINEARLLARFDHASLLKVYRFWEAHGTAYMVMPFYEGVTLGKLLAQNAEPPDEAGLRALLEPLLDALAQMHSAHCYHRDIAPDNILILPDGRPLLLDFGAARRVIGGMTQALTVILKTGYAPVEQYGEMPNMSQGAWTDLYALGSVVEFAITGRTPPQAVARFLGDKRVPLATAARGRYGESFLGAIDAALAVLPKDRPQTADEMRMLLGLPLKPVRKVEPISRPMPLGSPLSSPLPQESLRAQPSVPPTSTPVDFELDLDQAAAPPPRTSQPSRPPPAVTTHPPWTSVDTGEPIVTTPGGFVGRLTTQPRESLSADMAAVASKKTAASGLAGSLIVMGGSLLLLVAIVFAVYSWVSSSSRPYVAPASGVAPAAAKSVVAPPASTAAPNLEASSVSAAGSAGVASAGSPSASGSGSASISPADATPAAISSPAASTGAATAGDPAASANTSSNSNSVPAQTMPLPALPATPVDTTPAASTTAPEAASPTSTDAPTLQAPSPKPRKQPAAAAPARAAPADPPNTQYTPNKKLLNPRCADIIARVSLGEEPSAADKAILRRDCGQ